MNMHRVHITLQLLNVLSVVMCTLFFLDYTSSNQNYLQWVHILELYKKKYAPYNAYNHLIMDIARVLLTTYLCISSA